MKYCILSFFVFPFLMNSSIYDITIRNTQGQQVNLSSYQGKKILFVNIATASGYVNQLTELQQLQQQYEDSLVVIAFPSNNFGNEPRSNAAIRQFCQAEHGTSFLIASKGDVKGDNTQPVYKWLTRQTENGQLSSEVQNDFQKYIVDRNGELIGIFKGSVSPLDNQIVSVITGSFN